MKELLNYFRNCYFEAMEEEYPVSWGKEMAILKRLSKTYDDDTLRKYIKKFFTLQDSFLEQTGYRVQMLQSQIPKIQTQLRKETKETVSKTNKDAEAIAAAAKTLEVKGDF